MPEDQNKKAKRKGQVSSQDSPAAKNEKLQNLITSLTDNYREVNQYKAKQPLEISKGAQDIPGGDLKKYEAWLASAHNFFREASNQNVTLTYVSEWVLDNYYIIRQSLRQIKEDLPPSYYRQLPRLAKGPSKDSPRIYAVACEVLSFQNLLLNPIDLQTILIQYQETCFSDHGRVMGITDLLTLLFDRISGCKYLYPQSSLLTRPTYQRVFQTCQKLLEIYLQKKMKMKKLETMILSPTLSSACGLLLNWIGVNFTRVFPVWNTRCDWTLPEFIQGWTLSHGIFTAKKLNRFLLLPALKNVN